jgi:hypothetical protein
MKYKCLNCSKIHDNPEDAIVCCNDSNIIYQYSCAICDVVYEYSFEADVCCINEKVQEIEE